MALTPSRLIVARFRDGNTVKGSTHDFSPEKEKMHLYPMADEKKPTLVVPFNLLKAIFFVRSLTGNRYHVEDNTFRLAPGQGRKIRVTFQDGEEISGVAQGSINGRVGFFILPADPRSNNLRIFVIQSSVAKISWPTADTAPPDSSSAPAAPAQGR
ncbi:MAG TPA: hypothetical protein VGQ67_14220 [Candidatus Polarisedimenticolia bacterium]|nr:hypothetical protein [Candidatus Polarisedimenticolia bacterium]